MSLLETIRLSHVPEDTPVHVALYKDLKNASFLRQQLISGNTDFQYAFIDASVVGLNLYHIYMYTMLTATDSLAAACLCSSL